MAKRAGVSNPADASRRRLSLLGALWAGLPAAAAVFCLAIFLWLFLARPLPPQPRLLMEVAAVIGFIVGAMSFASVVGGGALLEEQSQAEPLRFQEAGWILGLPVGILAGILLVTFRTPVEGNLFNLYARPLIVAVAFAATLWAVLTRLLIRQQRLTRDDYACAIFMSREHYEKLGRRKQAWRVVRQVEKLGEQEARGHLPDIVPALAEKLRETRKEKTAEHIMSLLGSLGEGSVAPLLLEMLAAPSASNRRAAAMALGKLRLLESEPKLAEAALHDGREMVRRAAVVALGKLKSPTSLPALLSALQDPDVGTRQSATVALGHLRSTEALPALEEALKDRQQRVRQSAARAIERITGDQPEDDDE